jgi:glycosyltransferase involved in cell wall biosynthesis
VLRKVGPSEIYAHHLEAGIAHEVLPLGAYPARPTARTGGNVLLYHLSIGSPDVASFLLRRSERVGIVYHNITPSRFFRPYDAEFADVLDEGRRELAMMRQRASFAFAVSPYNVRELQSLGYANVGLTPLVVDVQKLAGLRPDPNMSRYLATQLDGPLILFVGQVLPHKRPDLLLAAFHVLNTYLLPEARVAFVGPGRVAAYRVAVGRYARELNLSRAWLTGWVRDEELVAFYRAADVLVTTSEHEGFCVPLLEAMAFDVPVVARPFAAIPETLGDAGVLLPAGDDPLLLAETVKEVLENDALRQSLVAKGRARLKQFEPDVARAAFAEQLLAVV